MKSIAYITTIIMVLGNSSFAQFTPTKDDVLSVLAKSAFETNNSYEISPWGNWVLETVPYSLTPNSDPDSVQIYIFPKSDLSNKIHLLTVHGDGKNPLIVEIKNDFGRIQHNTWSVLQDSIYFYVNGSTLNIDNVGSDSYGGEFFKIDISSITWVKIPDLEFAPPPANLPLKKVKPTPESLQSFSSPNPSSFPVNIRYYLPAKESVLINIYDSKGYLINILKEPLELTGWHNLEWNGLDIKGNQMKSGEYFYQIIAGEKITAKKIIILK